MITFTAKTDGAEQFLTALMKDQLPFGTSLALNRVTVAAQTAIRGSLSSHFTIAPGREAFMNMMVRFDRENYATKTKLETRLGVNDTEGPTAGSNKDRSFILGRHETGGVRTASADHPFAIPTKNIRPGAFDLVPRNLYPTALGLAPSRFSIEPRKVSRVKRQAGGKRSYFILKPPGNPKAWGIYERVTSGKGGNKMTGVRMIWAFRETITLPPRLHFYETAHKVFEEQWQDTFAAAWDEAVRTAR